MSITVQTNAYEIKWEPTQQNEAIVCHYDAIQPLWEMKPRPDGTPDIGKTKGMELVMRLQQTVAPNIFSPPASYDGKKNMYSTTQYQLGAAGASWIVPWDADRPTGRTVRIAVTFVKTVSMDTVRSLINGSRQNIEDGTQTLNMLNLFFQLVPRTSEGVFTTKSFFTKQNKKQLRNALEIWRGFFQSVRPARGRLIVNVDVTQGVVLPSEPLPSVIMRHLNLRDTRDLYRLDDRGLASLKAFLRGIKVTVNVGKRGRPKVIKAIVQDVGSQRFQKDGEEITVKDHFKRVHNKEIKAGEPGVKLGNDGLFPITVCSTVLQIYKRTNAPEIVRETLLFSPQTPGERLQAIKAGWQVLAYQQSPILIEAGINVSPNLLTVTGQQLVPPPIGFGNNKSTMTKQRPGQWDVMNTPLLLPGQAQSWIVLDFTNASPGAVSRFAMELCDAMSGRAIQIPKISSEFVIRANAYKPREELVANYKRFKPELIVAILPDNALPLYISVKRFGDIIQGVVTQCVKWTRKLEENVNQSQRRGALNQYQNNLILKMNVKLGGMNWLPLDDAMNFLRSEPTMILGADVSHPGPGSQLPSVASVVGSLDAKLLRYGAAVRIQSARTEMIAEIGVMFEGLLRSFYDINTRLPKRLFLYRDGVSEGEFETVRNRELQALAGVIEKAYGKDKNKWPSIMFIVVGKRHHFRFFPTEHSQADSRGNNNLHAGFTTDQGISHPIYPDFYLQSQAGLKGTSRPSHYTVLSNGLNMPINQIQQISFALCHCYSRSTRSVKVPAPVYYADLVCRRAKFHFEDGVEFDDAASMNSDENTNLSFYQSRWNNINEHLKNHMYFV